MENLIQLQQNALGLIIKVKKLDVCETFKDGFIEIELFYDF